MAVSAELKLLITASSDIKGAFDNLIKQLGTLQNAVSAVQAGLQATGGAQGAAAFQQVGNSAQSAAQQVSQFGNQAQVAGQAAAQGAVGVSKLNQGFVDTKNGAQVLAEAVQKLTRIVELVTGGFLGFKAVSIIKDILDTGAATETLNIALKVVGANAGFTEARLASISREVQKLGITSAAAAQSLTLMIQNKIPVDFAQPLARAAQDLAVVTGKNSSDTFQRLITNITQLDTVGLRFMGIIIDKEKILAEAAAKAGVALTQTQQQIVFTNAVLEEAAKLTGVYVTALESAGKALTSLPRIIEQFKVALSQGVQPVYSAIIIGTNELLEALTGLVSAFGVQNETIGTTVEQLDRASKQYSFLASVAKVLFNILIGGINFLKAHADGIGLIAKSIAAAGAIYLTFIGTTKLLVPALELVGAGFATLKLALDLTNQTQGFRRMVDVLELLFPSLTRVKLAFNGFIDAVSKGKFATSAFLGPLGVMIALLTAATVAILAAKDAFGKKVSVEQKAQDEALDAFEAKIKANRKAIEEFDQSAVLLKATMQRGFGLARNTQEFNDNQAAVERLTKDRKRLIENMGLTRKAADEEEQHVRALALSSTSTQRFANVLDNIAKVRKATLENAQGLADFDTALAAIGGTMSKLTGLSPEFAEAVSKTSQIFKSAFLDVNTIAAVAIPKYGELARAVKNSADFSEFIRQGHALTEANQRLLATGDLTKEKFKSNLISLEQAVGTAVRSQQKAEREAAQGGAENAAINLALKQNEIKRIAGLNHQALDDERKDNELLLHDNQRDYDIRLLSFQEFIEAKTQRQEKAIAIEREILKRQLKEQQDLQRTLPAEDVVGKDTARLQIAQTINDIGDLERRSRKEETDRERERFEFERDQGNFRLRLLNQIEGLKAKQSKQFDQESSQVDQIDKQYGEMLRKFEEMARIKGLLNDDEKETFKLFKEQLELAKQADIRRAEATGDARRSKFITDEVAQRVKILELTNSEGAIREENAEKFRRERERLVALADQNSDFDLKSALVQADITEQMELQNKLLANRQALQQREIAFSRAQLANSTAQNNLLLSKGAITTIEHQQRQNAITEKEIVNTQKEYQQALQQAELAQRNLEILEKSGDATDENGKSAGQLADEMQRARTNAELLQARIFDLRAEIVSVGDAWRKGFTEDMAAAFNDVLENGKRFGDAMRDLAKKLKNRFTETLTQNFAENVVKGLEGVAKAIGLEGGIFGTIGDLLFPKQRGDSPSKPMWTKDVDSAKDDVKDVFSQAKDFLGGFWDKIKEGFSGAMDVAGDFFGGLADGFGEVFDSIASFLGGIADGAGDLIGAAVNFVGGFFAAEGGTVPGTGTGDTVPAMLTPGEFVVPVKPTRMFYPILDAMRRGTLLPNLQLTALGLPDFSTRSPYPVQHFAEGGAVFAGKKAKAPPPQQVVLSIHPEAINMTLKDWLEGELARMTATR